MNWHKNSPNCARFPEIWTFFMWTQRNWEFRCNRKWSLNRQFQCKSKKNYRAQTPQNLALTNILHKFKKMSTPLGQFIFIPLPGRGNGANIVCTVYSIVPKSALVCYIVNCVFLMKMFTLNKLLPMDTLFVTLFVRSFKTETKVQSLIVV